MKDFVNTLTDLITQNELERLDNIMYDVAKNIQADIVSTTYTVIDAFYQDYTKADGRKYIRTDEYKHPRKDGKFRTKKKKEGYTPRRANDVSLKSAIKNEKNNEPAIGVCRPLDSFENRFGYQAGVKFDEQYFLDNMKHWNTGSRAGGAYEFTEWDIVEDFLWGVHGNEAVYTTTPSAGLVLYDYLHSYKSKFDKHYKNACKKFIK